MAQRIVTSAIALPLLLAIVWLGLPWFSILVALAVGIAAVETSTMSRLWGETVDTRAIIALSILLIIGAHLLTITGSGTAFIPPFVAVVSLASIAWLVWKRQRGSGPFIWLTPIAIILYPAGFLFHAPLLRNQPQGMEWVLFLLLITFATDTSAYFVGRAVGKRPLAPAISPSKTWEGAIGGIIGAVGVSIAASFALNLNVLLIETIVLGMLIGIVGQFGDLAESRLKRIASIKDSGWLIPGHGGILDRLDSIVFNIILVYYFVIWEIQQKGLLS